MMDKLESVRNEFLADLESFPNNPQLIDELRSKYLGRKGLVASLFTLMGKATGEERPVLGKELNILKNDLTEQFNAKVESHNAKKQSAKDDSIDITLPGKTPRIGSNHILEQTLSEIKDIFKSIGFHISYGPEVDDDYHNFSALNIPEHHPARDMQDTFFVDPNTVLRTHTSNVQIHLMETEEPPIRYIVPGRVYPVSYTHLTLPTILRV